MTPGNQSRDKGKRGQSEAMCVLRAKGYVVTESNSGRSCEDLIARRGRVIGSQTARPEPVVGATATHSTVTTTATVNCTEGETYAVEVKNHRQWDIGAWRKQAKDNAKKVNARWLLMCRIPGQPFAFYIEGQGIAPAVWGSK